MKLTEIIAEIQDNPNNVSAYRQLIEHYKDCNRIEEASAFEYLLEKKYGPNSTNYCKESKKSSNSDDSIAKKPELPDHTK